MRTPASRIVRTCHFASLLAGFAFALLFFPLSRLWAESIVFTSDTTIGATDMAYEGFDITAQGCTVTIELVPFGPFFC